MTVLQNVTLAPRQIRKLSKRAGRDDRAYELLDRIGLRDKADAFPDRLSGGQQQRVAIVRALAMDPKLMLLDEITSALDPQLVSEVLQLVRDLTEIGMTMIIATHEMSFAREVSSKICFLDAGRILEEGPAGSDLRRPARAAHARVPRPRARGREDVMKTFKRNKLPFLLSILYGVPLLMISLLCASLALDRPQVSVWKTNINYPGTTVIKKAGDRALHRDAVRDHLERDRVEIWGWALVPPLMLLGIGAPRLVRALRRLLRHARDDRRSPSG